MTTILVVENDPGICGRLTDLLQTELAAAVQCANTGALAAHAVDIQAFDLAIIDVGMPRYFRIRAGAARHQ
jgi:DNA-binding response OmpR family regulator